MDAVTKWSNFYRDGETTGTVAMWPNESLVRLFKARYFSWFKEDYSGAKVMDVGFGSGNNLRLCGTMGMELYGVEVSEEICTQISANMEKGGYPCKLKKGDNRNIPYPDNFFDYLLSWDVLHYEGHPDRVVEALAEYARVLKPGGRLFMSTIAPKHTIFQKSEIQGPHRYLLKREDDFRAGQVFFCFDSPQYAEYYVKASFEDVSIGRATLDYFFEINDTFLVSAAKPE